jgi:hypothetical protein
MFLKNNGIVFLFDKLSFQVGIISHEEPAQRYLNTTFCHAGNTMVTIMHSETRWRV